MEVPLAITPLLRPLLAPDPQHSLILAPPRPCSYHVITDGPLKAADFEGGSTLETLLDGKTIKASKAESGCRMGSWACAWSVSKGF